MAIDLLGCLCEAYQTNPRVNQKAVQNWRTNYLVVMKEAYEESELELDETDLYFKEITAAFDRLEAVAQKYPPFDWGI